MMSNIERSVVKRTITRLWRFEPSDCLPEKVADELEAAGRAAWARSEKGDCRFRGLLVRMCGGLSQLLDPYNTVLRLRCRFQEFKTQYDEEIAHIQVREFSS